MPKNSDILNGRPLNRAAPPADSTLRAVHHYSVSGTVAVPHTARAERRELQISPSAFTKSLKKNKRKQRSIASAASGEICDRKNRNSPKTSAYKSYRLNP